MPVNAPAEYFKAEEKFRSAKTKEEKIAALEEMIRMLPRHHGSETAHAQLKSRLAKLRKETVGKKGRKTVGITKEGDGQVCLLGFTNSGKSSLMSKITGARPEVAAHPYTTTQPEVGMMDYKGIKVQIIEIPATFSPVHMSIARTCDSIVLVVRGQNEIEPLEDILKDNFIRTKTVYANVFHEGPGDVKEKIWRSLGLIVVYTKKGKSVSPMALPHGATIKDFAQRIHKDFIKEFRFARIKRSERTIQAGLDYKLQDGDVVELHMRT